MNQRQEQESTADRWSELRAMPWWSVFEESCRASISLPRVAAVCLLERTAWSLMPQHELPWLSSFDFQEQTGGDWDEDCLKALTSSALTAQTSHWLMNRLTELQMTTAAAAAIVEDARQRILFSLLHGSRVSAALAGAVESWLSLADLEGALVEQLMRWWGEPVGVSDDISGLWLKAGELDSPLPPGKLAEVTSRSVTSAKILLQNELTNGGCMVIMDDGINRLDTLLPWLVEQYRHGGRFPLLVHGVALPWHEQFETSLEEYTRWLTGSTVRAHRSSSCALLMVRPDRALNNQEPVDGLELRQALGQWQQRYPNDWLIILLPDTSLLARHPLPGSLILKPVLTTTFDTPDRIAYWLPAPLRGSVARAGHFRAFVAETLKAGRTPTLSLALACYDLFGAPGSEILRPGNSCLEDLFEQSKTARPVLEQLLRDIIGQRWQSRSDFRLQLEARAGLRTNPARLDARIGARLYGLLRDLSSHGKRETFVNVDLGRWLCFLRAQSYEMAASVLACMEREQLAGVNLVHAPPMEFANLRQANLEAADLYHLNLADADLREACLVGADLSRAHLKRTDLRGADLRQADLSYCCLEQANLSGARVNGANLHRANTDSVVGLSPL